MSKLFVTILLLFLFVSVPCVKAQTDIPTINPVAVIIHDNESPEEVTSFSGSAPLKVRFVANVENQGSCTAYFEWRFYTEDSSAETPYLVRHEQDTEMTFMKDGSHCAILVAYFMEGNDTIASYNLDYWAEINPLRITIERSKLEFPNAFSPNGDNVNDVYRAKSGYSSIVEFKAAIYNRWGQKLYEWTDPTGGWDGKHNGRDVKQGVYYVHVVAKGADGRVYDIKRDVNLLRGFEQRTMNNTEE